MDMQSFRPCDLLAQVQGTVNDPVHHRPSGRTRIEAGLDCAFRVARLVGKWSGWGRANLRLVAEHS